MAYTKWADAVAAATSEETRRGLLAEIGRWRASRLTDIPALREAAFAMSVLYSELGDGDAAVREAKALLSLCQTPPLAREEELATARTHLERLGGSGIVRMRGQGKRGIRRKEGNDTTRSPRPPRARDTERDAEMGDVFGEAWKAAHDRRWRDALAALRGRRGPRAALCRAWIQLGEALSLTDDAARDVALESLLKRLEAQVAPSRPESTVREREKVESAGEHRLVSLLGGAIPKKWSARLRQIEGFLESHPHRVDEVASLALDHHVRTHGPKSPAPWLVGIVARAMVGGAAPETERVLERLRSEGAYAVTAYGERPFRWLLEVLERGTSRGWSFVGLRRGVLSRGEPRDRKLWTLRFRVEDEERLVAAAPEEDEPYRPETAERLARRLPELCSKVALMAPGEGNAELRRLAETFGVAILSTTDPEIALERVTEVVPVRADAPDAGATQGSRDSVLQHIGELVGAEELPDEDALVEALSSLRRIFPSFHVVREAVSAMTPEARDVRVALFLSAAHRAAPERARLPEGISLGVRVASEGGHACLEALTTSDAAERFGGPGIERVVDVARQFAERGWEVERVLKGSTTRERRADPVLDALGDTEGGLWRLRVAREGADIEVWILEDLTPEDQATVAQFLVKGRPDAVVLASEELGEWYASLGGPEAVSWAPGVSLALPTLQDVEASV